MIGWFDKVSRNNECVTIERCKFSLLLFCSGIVAFVAFLLFYTKLYSCDQTNPYERNFFLNNLKAVLSDQQKKNLQNDLSDFEIETAISQMAKGKAPGPDGLSAEFYIKCWPIVKK